MIGCSTRTGDASRLLVPDVKERDGTLGSTALRDEAVQPRIGRLGWGDGDGGKPPELEDFNDERGGGERYVGFVG